MFEVAVCISAYIVVMWLEFSPAFFEKWGMVDAKKKLNKVLFFLIALGTVLPMMHQSSLGTLIVVMGVQINPLWQTQIIPLLFLLTAIVIGYGVVLFESCVASSAYRRKIELHLLEPMAKIMLGMLAIFVVVRFGDLLVRGALPFAFKGNLAALAFWVETLCFVAPFALIGSATHGAIQPSSSLLALPSCSVVFSCASTPSSSATTPASVSTPAGPTFRPCRN